MSQLSTDTWTNNCLLWSSHSSSKWAFSKSNRVLNDSKTCGGELVNMPFFPRVLIEGSLVLEEEVSLDATDLGLWEG